MRPCPTPAPATEPQSVDFSADPCSSFALLSCCHCASGEDFWILTRVLAQWVLQFQGSGSESTIYAMMVGYYFRASNLGLNQGQASSTIPVRAGLHTNHSRRWEWPIRRRIQSFCPTPQKTTAAEQVVCC